MEIGAVCPLNSTCSVHPAPTTRLLMVEPDSGQITSGGGVSVDKTKKLTTIVTSNNGNALLSIVKVSNFGTSSTIRWAVTVFLLIVLLFPSALSRRWSIEELTSQRFPYQSSNDRYLDVCKADGFLADIALTKEEIWTLRYLNLTLKKTNRTAQDPYNFSIEYYEHHRNTRKGHGGYLGKAGREKVEKKLWHEEQEKKPRLMNGSKQRGRRRRAATARKERIWDYGVIPYEIQANFSGEHKALFRQAMRHWENYTCLSFVERTPEDENYIVFTVAECGCCSYVGKRGEGPQAISIGKNCDKFGIVVHELGHVVGFWHEHTRPDRDQFVDIYYKNIQQGDIVTMVHENNSNTTTLPTVTPSTVFNVTQVYNMKESNETGQDYNFEKLKLDDVNSLGEPYDFASIMHYARDTFARAMYMDTILPKPDPLNHERPEIGQRIRLSPGDIRQANLLYKCPSCGRTLMNPSGRISVAETESKEAGESINIAAVSVPSDCQWRIIATKGERISLNISGLILPDPVRSIDCQKEKENFLEIRDGYYEKSRLIAKYCDTLSEPQRLQSEGNRVWIRLKTSLSSSVGRELEINGKRGTSQSTLAPHLLASYEVVCGGHISADEGTLQSPNYPDDYRSNQDCTWYITVPEDYQVALKFQLFQLEQHQDCIYDRLEVYDGHGEDAKRLGKFCGYTLPLDVKSSGNRMKIRFYSDNSVEKGGFALEFMKEFDECKTGQDGCQHKCVNTLGGFRCECDIGYELHIDGKSCEDACGGYIKANNGTLTSPNFPQLYPASKKCIWEIEAHPQYRITLNFTHFDMEGITKNCEYDFVKVTSIGSDGKTTKVHGSYCGTIASPHVVTSETNRLRVEFHSDTSVQKSGFAAVFFTDMDECDLNNGHCDQICRNTIGSYECECQSGFVLAEDGHNCKEGGCKYELNAPNGEISSPNYPDEYPNKKECVWHFVTTPGHRLELKFQEFEVEPHQSCRYDRIELYDGSSTSATSLGTYCGSKFPDDILSTKNELYMLFVTDPSVSRKGFLAKYTSKCGGTLQADESVGYIYSHAKYGGSDYETRMECEWTVLGQPEKVVQIRFKNFDVEDENNCDYDWVQIYDGEDERSTDLGRFCGKNKLPPSQISTGKAIRIQFRTDDTVQSKGFVLEYFLREPPEEGDRMPTAPTKPPTSPPLEPVINERNKHFR